MAAIDGLVEALQALFSPAEKKEPEFSPEVVKAFTDFLKKNAIHIGSISIPVNGSKDETAEKTSDEANTTTETDSPTATAVAV